uniref:5-formyltetrahydrofolate cyclo-ligase n=2 Tax=Crocodylus porosus TaxID=8502 RepID=A0A7M4FIC0_CROPO
FCLIVNSGWERWLRVGLREALDRASDPEKLRTLQGLKQHIRVIGHSKYKESQRIAVFLSMQDEIQTEDIIKDIFNQGKECFIPQYKPQSNHMDMLKLASVEEISSLPVTSWNILQPSDDDIREEALSGGGLDLILMPGLGFDKNGNRLGRGKGYYDTYLERCMKHPRGKPYTIALAFKEQICESVPVSENDIQIDEVLYEDS